MHCDLANSIPEWMIEHPETTQVFDRLQLDCSCGGRSLQYACESRGLNPATVLAELTAVVAAADASRLSD